MTGRRARFAIAGAMLIALCPAPALSQPKARPAAAGPAMKQASKHFLAGQKLYAERKFEQALVELRASYEAVKSPNSRLYIARCLRGLGRLAAAYDEYAQVILEAADRSALERKYAATQKAAIEERAELRGKVAAIHIAIPAGTRGAWVRINGEEIATFRPGEDVTVAAGSVVVRVEAPGHRPFEKTIAIAGGERKPIDVDWSKDAELDADAKSGSRGPLRPLAIATGGVGIAGLALWGVLGVKASARYDELRLACDGRCGPRYQSDVDAGRTETMVSNVGLIVGVVGVAGGAALFAVDLYARRKPSSAASGTTVAIAVVPDLAGPGVRVGGAF